MLKEETKKDIYFKDYLASRVIMDDKIIAGYDKVYYQINEDIVMFY